MHWSTCILWSVCVASWFKILFAHQTTLPFALFPANEILHIWTKHCTMSGPPQYIFRWMHCKTYGSLMLVLLSDGGSKSHIDCHPHCSDWDSSTWQNWKSALVGPTLKHTQCNSIYDTGHTLWALITLTTFSPCPQRGPSEPLTFVVRVSPSTPHPQLP